MDWSIGDCGVGGEEKGCVVVDDDDGGLVEICIMDFFVLG